MKRIIIIVLCVVLSLAGCAGFSKDFAKDFAQGFSKVPLSELYVGMSVQDLQSICARPTSVDRSTDANGVHEQWYYNRGPYMSKVYLYIDNGELTSWQEF